MSARPWSRLFFSVPVILAALISLTINAHGMWQQARQANPFDPWESAITTEAYRISVGQPVYVSSVFEIPAQGRATHMYGPLPEFVLGGLFHLTGPSVHVARLFSVVAAMGIIVLAVGTVAHRLGWAGMLAGAALLMGADNYASNYFVYGKPDVVSVLFAFLGAFFSVRALSLDSVARCWVASVLFVAAFFSKQNMAGLALAVPMAYMLNCIIDSDRLTARKLLMALAPVVSVGVTVLLLRQAAPVV